jgi:hypothetical protein
VDTVLDPVFLDLEHCVRSFKRVDAQHLRTTYAVETHPKHDGTPKAVRRNAEPNQIDRPRFRDVVPYRNTDPKAMGGEMREL